MNQAFQPKVKHGIANLVDTPLLLVRSSSLGGGMCVSEFKLNYCN